MLEATFIGHQGWLLSTGRTRILVDPLLGQGFGHGGLAGEVYPKRRFDFDALGAIDAVVITHEHDDHFDIPSLLRIDRSVPVFASARSSTAMREVLAQLGFRVKLLRPQSTVSIGDLSYRTFVAQHRSGADEWDVFPYVVTDAAGQGAFASSVDVATPAAMVDALAKTPGWPGVLCLANNTTDTRFVQRDVGMLVPSDDTDVLASVLRRRWQALSARSGSPRWTAITGGGWRHPREHAWIDRVAFSVNAPQLARTLDEAGCGPSSAVRPGDVLRLDAAGIDVGQAGFVTVAPGSRRAEPQPVEVPTVFAPACGRTRLTMSEEESLEAGLQALAAFWFDRSVFVAMHSSPDARVGVVLRDEAGPRVYEYAPEATSFRRVDLQDPFNTLTSGFECWATDLVGLFEGQIGPSALCYTGRLRCWNHDADRLRISPHELWRFAHPLHRPNAARRLYLRLAAACGADE